MEENVLPPRPHTTLSLATHLIQMMEDNPMMIHETVHAGDGSPIVNSTIIDGAAVLETGNQYLKREGTA